MHFQSKNSQDLRLICPYDFDLKIEEKIRGGYAEGRKTGLSLFKSMVPAGGIEPTAQIENT